jgi:hypothetical protein
VIDSDTNSLQQLKAELVNALATGERLVWAGMPSPSRTLKVTSPILFFGVPWLLFVTGWEIMALWMLAHVLTGNSSNTPWPIALVFSLFGFPFVGIGIWLVRKPFVEMCNARHRLHVVTNHRLITLTHEKDGQKLNSFPLSEITGTQLKHHADGTGSLQIQLGTVRDSDGDRVSKYEDWVGIADACGADQAVRSIVTVSN